jgi:glycosyltransferase involved in cell wall biosynthesis
MTFTKKHILIFTDWYLPGYKAGGPIRSLANLVQGTDHFFHIVTRNTDHHSTEAYKDIEPNKWIELSSRVRIIYFEEKNLNQHHFAAIIQERRYDKIYLNSLFSPRFTILPLRIISKFGLKSKTVLAPRGMLKSGALSVKARKKKIFLLLAKLTGLYQGITWHATNATEAEEIRNHFGEKCMVKIAPNLIAGGQREKQKPEKKSGTLRLISIARISPEKGILEAIQFLGAAALGSGVECKFYGTQQNESYLQECIQAASVIEGAQITFPGEILHDLIAGVMSESHFFYMTTWGENFGHAIAEALLESTPVIISDRTPWKNLQSHGAGWDLPLNAASFVPVLRTCYDMDHATYTTLASSAFRHGYLTANDPESLSRCYEIFE